MSRKLILFQSLAISLSIGVSVCGMGQVVVSTPAPPIANLSVDAAAPSVEGIPRTLFGTFLEPIGNSTYNGLWAQLLKNPSFELGLWDSAHVDSMVRRTPGLQRASELGLPLPWEPLQGTQGNRYLLHWGDAANSWCSLEIIGVPGRATGIRQKIYLPVQRELTYKGSLFAKHLSGSSTLLLQIRKRNAGEVLAQTKVLAQASGWTQYAFTLTIPANRLVRLEPADFAVLVSSDERADVDNIQLFPADAVDGMDPDVIRLAKAMHTPLVRFGGNFTSAYNWRDGIGAAQKRISMRNIAWGIPEYNTFGTDEFLEFCRLIDAKPQIALNMGSGTPEEAAAWVRYVNHHFARGNGGLLWELGNELWGNWNMGWPTLQQLPDRTRRFSQAVLQVDPGARLIATGADMDGYKTWNAAQLTDPPGTFHYLSTHFVVDTDHTVLAHPTADFLALATFGLPAGLAGRLHAAEDQIQSTPGYTKKTRLAFTEWLYVAHRWDAPQFTNMGGAIGAASFLNMLLRNADIVPISDMTGIMEFAGIWKQRGQVYAAPAYYAFKMYAGADITRLVSIINNAGSYTVHKGISRLPEIADVPYLDTVAALNATGDTMTVFVVNHHLHRDQSAVIQLNGFNPQSAVQVATLRSFSLYDGNSAEDPQHIIPVYTTVTWHSGRMQYVFPRASITVLTFRKRERS
jgi:alpha-N-arabinofuranosidase